MRVLAAATASLSLGAFGAGARAGVGATDLVKQWPGRYLKSTSDIEAQRAYQRDVYKTRLANAKGTPRPVHGTLTVGSRTFSLVTESCLAERKTALATIPGHGTAYIELAEPDPTRDVGLSIILRDGRYYGDFYSAASRATLRGERLYDVLLSVEKKRSPREFIAWMAKHSWRWTIRLRCAR